MTTAIVIALATVLLATARWGLNHRFTAHGVYPPRGLTENHLLADARRDLKRSQDLGASLGHLQAWRDLLSSTATEASKASGTNQSDSRADTRRRDLDTTEEWIRSALADLDRRRAGGSTPSGAEPEGRSPWSG